MHQRSKEILLLLLERTQSSLHRLAEIHEVSERTIRNDFSDLNDYLQNLQAGQIQLKQKQVSLVLTIDKQQLHESINKFSAYEYKLSREERSLICLLILISSHGYVTLNQLSEKLLASRSTVVNDMKSVRKLAAENQLKVVSKANKGFQLTGREEDCRRFLYRIIRQENFTILESLIFEENYQQQIDLPSLQQMAEASRGTLAVSEKDLSRLLSYLVICSYRNLKGFPLEGDFSCSKDLLDALATPYRQAGYPYLTETDLAFICQQVLEKPDTDAIEADFNREALSTQVTAMQFIEAISADLAIDFKEDYIFYENFSAHLLRMLREKEQDSHKGLDISTVVETNPKIKRAILKHLPIIEKSIGRSPTSLETDYIIIHVYAAMERKKRIGSNLKVAVLTEQKAAEVFLIESKLISNFSFSLDIYAIDDTIRGEYDLILTTTPLPGQNYLTISPFISDEDYILIASHVNRIVHEKAETDLKLDKDTALKIYQMVAGEIDQTDGDKDRLKERIRDRMLAYTDTGKTEAEGQEKLLHEFLTPDQIELDVAARDWQESIYRAGEGLIQKGAITEAYLEAVITTIKERGPYVVISQGFAFPHAQLGDYNKATAMKLIRLKTPVYFNDEEQDKPDDITTMPVRYVCILSTTDRKQHLKAMFNLFNLLKDKRFKAALDVCETPEAVYQFIEEQEKLLELRR